MNSITSCIAGVDEAGRGPLAGPVVAAAVILNDEHPILGLNDSKALTSSQRDRLEKTIKASALSYCIAQASAAEIDQLNILQATLLAMRRAVEGLHITPHQVLIDGNQIPRLAMPAQAIIKGDATVAAISAASILAKVHRDRICLELHEQYPQYGFASHKGYPTAAHILALQNHGPCPAHRHSFAPVQKALNAVPYSVFELCPPLH
jgi:ribonuclease HII